MMMPQRILGGVSALCLTAALFSTHTAEAQTANVPCNTITMPNSPIPSGYGSPLDFFGTTHYLLSVVCTGSAAIAQVGSGLQTQYIYKYGYEKINGAWKQITFTGSQTNGPWIIGNASALLSATPYGAEGTVLAYVCQYIQGAWKCGCSDHQCNPSRWQIQRYLRPNEPVGHTGAGDGVVDVHYPSAYLGLPGDTIVLTGTGFETSPVSDVLWNSKVGQTKVVSQDGASLTITVPKFTPGRYEVKVREGNAVSTYGTVIWIGTGVTQPPKINAISPNVIQQGGTITVIGEGFTPTNNDVITTFGVVSGLASKDGKTLTFTYDPFGEDIQFYTETGAKRPVAWDIYVTVANTSGMSESKMFYLNI